MWLGVCLAFFDMVILLLSVEIGGTRCPPLVRDRTPHKPVAKPVQAAWWSRCEQRNHLTATFPRFWKCVKRTTELLRDRRSDLAPLRGREARADALHQRIDRVHLASRGSRLARECHRQEPLQEIGRAHV